MTAPIQESPPRVERRVANPGATSDSSSEQPTTTHARREGDSHTPPSDLGLGRVVTQRVRGRFLNRDGRPNSRKYGLGAQLAQRLYMEALHASWPAFLLWTIGTLLLVNGSFALAYAAIGDGAIQGLDRVGVSDPFLASLAFSMGVFTTTGTGPMYAMGATATWLVIFESLVGPLTLVAISGLLIARLTRPRMQLRFSESLIIAPYEGGRGAMFRMTNVAPGDLSNVRARIILSWFEDFDGVRERNFHPLELERDSVELFTLHWTVVHPITASSPLAGVTPDILREREAEFIIHIAAHEDTFSTEVRSRTSYVYDEVRWDAKFATIFTSAPDDIIAIDVERLSRTEPLSDGATRVPAPSELTNDEEDRAGAVL